MVKPIKLFSCPKCYLKHEEEEDAITCHRPTVFWKCSTCDHEDYLSEETARKCCKVRN